MPIAKSTQPPRFQVDNIFFNLRLIKAQIPIRFKCRFLVEVKTTSSSSTLRTLCKSKDQYRQIASMITFDNDEKFQFSQYMVYDNELGRYKKTEIQIVVSLVSDNRSDEVKLVGRVRTDLNEFMIDNRGEIMLKEQQLQNCSVKKPQIAKLQYELSLIRQEKMNIAQNPNRETICAQIDKGVFPDAVEYNAFGREVFGKDFSMITMGKINRSMNESKMNESKGNVSREESMEKIEKGSVKDIVDKSLKEVKEKDEGIDDKKIEENVIKLNISKKDDEKQKQSQQQSSIIPSLQFQQQPISQQQRQQTAPTKPSNQSPHQSPRQSIKKSPIKRSLQSPRHKSKLTHPVSQQMTQIQAQSQQKKNQLTDSMFDQQQMVIESLQEQLEEAKEVIEQYRLEMELMKEETERLENEKSMHASQLQTSRARNQPPVVNIIQGLSEQHWEQESHSLKYQLQNYKDQLQTYKDQISSYKDQISSYQSQISSYQSQLAQYKKVFTEKQQIIEQKDQVIANLSAQIEMAAHQIDSITAEKDEQYRQLQSEYDMIKQEEAYLKAEVQRMKAFIEGNGEMNEISREVEQLRVELQKQRTAVVELELKQADLETSIQTLRKTIDEQNIKILKKQQTARKNIQLKDKAEQQLKKAEQQLKKTQQQLKKAQQQIKKAQQQMTKALEKAKSIQKEKYQLSQQITTLNLNSKSVDKLVQQKVHSYKSQYDELVLSYEESQNKITQLKFAVQSYQSTLSVEQSKSQFQISQLTQKLSNFNKKEHLLRQSLDLLENQTAKIRIFVQEKQVRLREFEDLLQLKDDELTEKNDRVSFLERKLRMNENTINDLKLQLKMANAMNLEAHDARQQRDGDQQLQTRLYILNEANLQLVQKQKHQSELIDQKQQTIHQLQKSLSTLDPLKLQISSLQTKLSLSEQKCRGLNQELTVFTKAGLEQQSQSEQQTQELQHLYKQCQKLQEQLNLTEDQKILWVNQFQDKENQCVKMQEALNTGKQRQKTLQRQLHSKDIEITKLTAQIEQAQKAQKQLTRKITLLEQSPIPDAKKQDLLIQSRTLINQHPEPLSAIRSPIKDALSSPRHTRTHEEQEIYRLNEELQTYKQREESYMCNVLDLQEQLEVAKKERLSSSLNEQRQSIRKSQSLIPTVVYDKQDLKAACDQLEKLIDQRINNRQTQNLIQMIVSNSQMLGGSESRTTNEQGTLFARQKNSLQEKSRILSREVQKIKSLIFKKAEIPYKNKTEIIQLLKPCENITNELVKIAESISRENEDEAFSEN